MERWRKARSLAAQGYTVVRASREIGINHSTAIYIAKQMGFKWAPSLKGRYLREPMERVERMMRLASR